MKYFTLTLILGLTACAANTGSRYAGSWGTEVDDEQFLRRMLKDGTALVEIPASGEEYAGRWTELPDGSVSFNFGAGHTDTPATARLLSDAEILATGPSGKALTLDRQAR